MRVSRESNYPRWSNLVTAYSAPDWPFDAPAAENYDTVDFPFVDHSSLDASFVPLISDATNALNTSLVTPGTFETTDTFSIYSTSTVPDAFLVPPILGTVSALGSSFAPPRAFGGLITAPFEAPCFPYTSYIDPSALETSFVEPLSDAFSGVDTLVASTGSSDASFTAPRPEAFSALDPSFVLPNTPEGRTKPRPILPKGPVTPSGAKIGPVQSKDNRIRCDYPGCRETFSRRYNLQRHRNLHNNPCAYSCDLCDYKNSRKDKILKHKRKYH